MIYWLRFALRSVVRRRRRTMVTFISVGFGVAMLIVLGAIMVGVNDTMVKNAVALRSGHLVVEWPAQPLEAAVAQMAALDEQLPPVVEAMLPRFGVAAMVQSHNQVQPLQLQLVEPERELSWSPIPATLMAGHWLHESAGLVLGSGVAQALAVSVGDELQLVTAQNHYRLKVAGIFQCKVAALDNGRGFLSLAQARQLGLQVAVQGQAALFAAAGAPLEALRRQLQPQVASAEVLTWREKMPEVEQLVKLNQFSMQIMMVLVIAILAFGIANSLLISVMDRYRYYGILKALGTRPREVMTTVVAEAVILCLGAGLLGTGLGVVISLVWGDIGLDIGRYTSYNPHFSIDSMIYPRLQLTMVLLPQLLALISGVLASLWPATVAARRRVSSSMRDL